MADPFADAGFAPVPGQPAIQNDPFAAAGFAPVQAAKDTPPAMPTPVGWSEFGAPIFDDTAEGKAAGRQERGGELAMAEKVGEGATFGMLPHAIAAARAIGGTPYQEGLQSARDFTAQTSKDYPVPAALAEGAGSIGTGLGLFRAAGPAIDAAANYAPRIGGALGRALTSAGIGAGSSLGHDVGAGDYGSVGSDVATGAGLGAALSGAGDAVGRAAQAVPNMARGLYQGVRNITTDSGRTGVVGQILREAGGEYPNQAAHAPIPGLDLRVAQATGNPGLAGLERTMGSEAGMQGGDLGGFVKNGTTPNQTSALASALVGSDGRIEPAVLTNQASAKGVQAIHGADEALGGVERKLWEDPALSSVALNGPGIAQGVKSDVAAFPASWRDAVTGPQNKLGSFLNELHELGPDATIPDVNSVRSRLLSVARDASSGPQPDSVTAAAANRMAGSIIDRVGMDPAIAGAPEIKALPDMGPMPPLSVRTALESAAPIYSDSKRAPESLVDFLISRGGVRDSSGDLKSMGADAVHHRAGGRLLNPNGMPQDYAREAAQEAGFLGPQSTINDLQDAIGEHISGRPQYRISEQADGLLQRNASGEADRQSHSFFMAHGDIQDAADRAGVKLSPAAAEHAAQLASAGTHPDQAIQDAARAEEEQVFQRNADRLGASPPGVPIGATQGSLPIPAAPSPAIAPNPAAFEAYQTARDFTRQFHQAKGYNEFNDILHPNSQGNMQGNPEKQFGRFFDLGGGTDAGLKRLQGLSDFARQSGLGSHADELDNAGRQYLNAAILRQSRAGNGLDVTGQPNLNLATLASTTNKLAPTLNATPMTARIAGDVQAAGNAAELLNRPSTLRGDTNSTTYEKLRNNDLVSAIVGQSGSSALGAAAGGYAGYKTGDATGQPAYATIPLGMMVGALAGNRAGPAIGNVISHTPILKGAVTGPSEAIRRQVWEALSNMPAYERALATPMLTGPSLGAPGSASRAVPALARALIPTATNGGAR